MKAKAIFQILFSALALLLIGSVPALIESVGTGDLSADIFLSAPVLAILPVKRELFTGRMIEKFRFVGSWVARLRDESSWVGNNVIRLVDIGADPKVLVDNTTYPIAITALDDEDIAISLKKYDTENTPVTDDELYAITYPKIDSVVNRHVSQLEEFTAQHGLHAIAPPENSVAAGQFVIKTTGANDGTGRKRLTKADMIRLKRLYDEGKVPKEGRNLVLCPEHIEDILLFDESFALQYMNIREGQVLKAYGFNIYEDLFSPRYHRTNLTKVGFGAADAATDGNASISFYEGDCFRAAGSTSMYYRDASVDPEYRRTVAGFRQYFLILPYKRRSQGAIVSDAA